MSQTPSTRVAIHGFGRVGRQIFKAFWDLAPAGLEVAAIGLSRPEDAPAAAHLLKYDSNYGQWKPRVRHAGGALEVDGRRYSLVTADSLAGLPWAAMGVDLVIDASGDNLLAQRAAGHLEAGARRVLLAAPSDDADLTVIYGVNEGAFDPARHRLISTGSDTTNALAPVVRVLEDAFGVENAMMTAIHAYTNEQKLIDAPDVDLRRARSAPTSIVPTTTRAATAIAQVYPEMTGRLGGYAVRVPVAAVSILQVTAHLRDPQTPAAVNEAFRAAAAGPLGRVMTVSDAPLVSTDFRGCRHSAVIDLPTTIAIGPLVKVAAWYDNVTGYAARVVDTAAHVAGA
jgi:glyceraldehyde 3-phosphate dehydrogenase